MEKENIINNGVYFNFLWHIQPQVFLQNLNLFFNHKPKEGKRRRMMISSKGHKPGIKAIMVLIYQSFYRSQAYTSLASKVS